MRTATCVISEQLCSSDLGGSSIQRPAAIRDQAVTAVNPWRFT
jgi:hypothetical protein